MSDYVIDTACQIHDAQGVFKAPMSCAWINKIGKRQLVDVAEALEGTRVDYLSLLGVYSYESVDGISDFMISLLHGKAPPLQRGALVSPYVVRRDSQNKAVMISHCFQVDAPHSKPIITG